MELSQESGEFNSFRAGNLSSSKHQLEANLAQNVFPKEVIKMLKWEVRTLAKEVVGLHEVQEANKRSFVFQARNMEESEMYLNKVEACLAHIEEVLA